MKSSMHKHYDDVCACVEASHHISMCMAMKSERRAAWFFKASGIIIPVPFDVPPPFVCIRCHSFVSLVRAPAPRTCCVRAWFKLHVKSSITAHGTGAGAASRSLEIE